MLIALFTILHAPPRLQNQASLLVGLAYAELHLVLHTFVMQWCKRIRTVIYQRLETFTRYTQTN